MARTPTPEEIVQNAHRAQQARTNAVEAVALAHVAVVDARKRADERRAALEEELRQTMAQVEREEVSSYNAAIAAGWTEKELKSIGLPTPIKKARVASKGRTKARAKKEPTPTVSAVVTPQTPPVEVSNDQGESHEG